MRLPKNPRTPELGLEQRLLIGRSRCVEGDIVAVMGR